MNPAGDTKTNAQRLSGCIGSLFSRKSGAAAHFADIISETSNENGDIKTNAQRPSECIRSLFSRKPRAVSHFANIISETSDVNVPGPYQNTASKPETPNTEPSPKQLISEVETIQIDSEDENDTAPPASIPQIYDPKNPYTYQCNLSQEKLDKLAEDDDEELDDDSLKAFLNILRIESGKPVIVVSSHYRKRLLRLGLTKSLYDGDLKNFETAIIPIHMPDTEAAHWVLGIYRRNESILYFDSIGITYGMVKSKDGMTLELVTNWISETLKSAVRDITRDTDLDPKIEAVPLDGPQFDHYRPKYRINPQMDGVNCGFHIALIAEVFLMNNEDVFLENFNIATERTRILDILSGLRDNNYRYIPRNVHNIPNDVDIDLEMQQSDNDMNDSDKISDFCKNETMEKETVVKSVKNDHEKAAVPEMMNQLVENVEAFTLENDWPKASNNGQSHGLATNSDEALPNPEQKSDHEMSSVEVDSAKLSQLLNKIKAFILENDKENASYQRQSPGSATNSDKALLNPEQKIEVNTLPMANDQRPDSCKGTVVLEKLDPEANAQPKTNVQQENLSKDENEKDTNKRENKKRKRNNDSSEGSENLRKKVEANPVKYPEQFENDRLYSILEEYANATALHAKQISELSQKHSQTLASLKSELQLLCQNYKTSQDVALEVARPQLEQSHNILAIDQALPHIMLDHFSLTDCPTTSLPFFNQHFNVDKVQTEERDVDPNIDFNHLISTLFYPDAISSIIPKNEVEINTADHFHGIIEELQDSNLTCANTTVTDCTLIRKRNEVQSTVNSSASSVLTASDMSIPTKSLKCAKAKYKHIASKAKKLSMMNQEQSSTYKNARKLRNSKIVAKTAKLHKCTQCSYTSNRSDALKRHFRIHTGEKPYKCNQCPFATARDTKLRMHTRTHSNYRPYKCNECSYASNQKVTLQTHMRSHTCEKPYKRTHCSYASIQKANLWTHMRIHTGEKPYKCINCSYACTQMIALKLHMRTHTGEKPYKCDQCSYVCAQKSNLKTHMYSHAIEKPYKCTQCSYVCSRKVNLQIHICSHTGEKPFKCTQCSFSSARADSLNAHMQTHSGRKMQRRNAISDHLVVSE